MQHSIFIRKEALKFSAAHATVFPDGTKERLHGHNYFTELKATLADTSLSSLLSFSVFKAALDKVCRAWDEKVLLAKDCPFLKITHQDAQEVEFTLCGKRYVLPADEVEWLATANTTSENLAAEVLRRVRAELEKHPSFKNVLSLEIRVTEGAGQGAGCLWERGL